MIKYDDPISAKKHLIQEITKEIEIQNVSNVEIVRKKLKIYDSKSDEYLNKFFETHSMLYFNKFLENCSIDRLLWFLNKLYKDIDIVVR